MKWGDRLSSLDTNLVGWCERVIALALLPDLFFHRHAAPGPSPGPDLPGHPPVFLDAGARQPGSG